METQQTKESIEPVPVRALQITQINVESIPIQGIITSGDPLEPLVSAEVQETASGTYINIRFVVLVAKILLGKKPISLFQDMETEKNELKFIVKCNSTELIAENYYCWYVSYMHYVAEGDPEIDIITSRIEDLIPGDSNPKTSRGTITRVLRS